MNPWVESAGLPVVFLPGWAFSGRVLALADHDSGGLVLDSPSDPATLLRDLLAFLNASGLDRVHLTGWSMGGNLALDFAAANPHRVAALTLLGVRAAWPSAEIAAIRRGLADSPDAFLRDFYRKCFLGSRNFYRRFVAEQQEALLAALDQPLLERGLAYLADWRMPEALPDCPILCGHGRKDVIAPLGERVQIPGAQFYLAEHGGHAFFLDRQNDG